MNTYLVTGPSGFLGYHVIKLLNTRGNRPRVLLPADIDPQTTGLKALKTQDIDIVEGDIGEPAFLQTACSDMDVILRMNFTISFSEGEQTEQSLYEDNVVGSAISWKLQHNEACRV